jgi:signal transduction histidine kinase
MDTTLRTLIVEDSENDCAALLAELRRSDREVRSRIIKTAGELEAALDEEEWDVIIADYGVSMFGGWDALELMYRRELDVPYILVVSDPADEASVVTLMRAGVHDYVFKNHLARLGPAVEREVREAEMRRKNKRAEEQLRQHMDALLAIYEASQLLSSTLESEEIGTRLLKLMRRISHLTTAVISIPDNNGRLQVWRAIGFENLWHRVRYTPEAQEALYKVLGGGEPLLLELAHPDNPEQHLSTLYLPLRIKERILGVLEIYGPQHLTQSGMVEILISLTSKAASALENARLYGELAERERLLQELVGRLIAAQEEERRHVAYEIHDGLTQVAVAAYQHLQAFSAIYAPASPQEKEMMERATELVQRTVGDSRQVIAGLRPTELDDFGLDVALRLQVDSLGEEGWDIVYESSRFSPRLPTAVETALYRVFQEAINNIRKHAATERVRVELGREADVVRLTVRDWGRGFEVTALAGDGPGERVGVSGMRERVTLVGGELEVHSERGSGTRIAARVPLPKTDEASHQASDPLVAKHERSDPGQISTDTQRTCF